MPDHSVDQTIAALKAKLAKFEKIRALLEDDPELLPMLKETLFGAESRPAPLHVMSGSTTDMIVKVFEENGNQPLTIKDLVKATKAPLASIKQVVYRLHKTRFVHVKKFKNMRETGFKMKNPPRVTEAREKPGKKRTG